MIDYNHPIILRMKDLYRDGNNAFEIALVHLDHPIFRSELLGKANDKLETARTEISHLIEQMRNATDLPAEDRDYYIPFMEEHLTNVHGWYEKTQRFLE